MRLSTHKGLAGVIVTAALVAGCGGSDKAGWTDVTKGIATTKCTSDLVAQGYPGPRARSGCQCVIAKVAQGAPLAQIQAEQNNGTLSSDPVATDAAKQCGG